jgi:hypothetical protein
MPGRFIPLNKPGQAVFILIIIFGIIGPVIALNFGFISTGMTQLGPDDCVKAAWSAGCSWGQAAGLNLESIVFLEYEPNSRRLLSTVEYLDQRTSLLRRVFFDLEYSESSGWRRICIKDFSILPNFSAPLVSPKSIIHIVPEFLEAYEANFLITIKTSFCYLFGSMTNRCMDSLCFSDPR